MSDQTPIDTEDATPVPREPSGSQVAAILLMLLGEEEAATVLSRLEPDEVQHLGGAMFGVADISDGDDVKHKKVGGPHDTGEPQQAKPNQVDKGKVVTTAFGEPMSGGIADISDGDDE